MFSRIFLTAERVRLLQHAYLTQKFVFCESITVKTQILESLSQGKGERLELFSRPSKRMDQSRGLYTPHLGSSIPGHKSVLEWFVE